MGIGDDAAVLPQGLSPWLISQDMLVEGTHFRWDWSRPAQVGHKAAAVNLSDIAAMGGVPRAVLTSLAVPRNTSMALLEALYGGMVDLLEPFGVPIVGGDTVGTRDLLVLDVTILGSVSPTGPVLRRGAQVGDRLLVTGRLGASRAGMALLLAGTRWPDADGQERELLAAHLTPTPRVAFAQAVAGHIHAMTDVSDELAVEVASLTRGTSMGADIQLDQLPISMATREVAARFGVVPQSWAVFGGEDYELLMAVPPGAVKQVQALGDDIEVTEIGVVTDTGRVCWMKDGCPLPLKELEGEDLAFDHFAD